MKKLLIPLCLGLMGIAHAQPLSLPAALELAGRNAPQLSALAARAETAQNLGTANAALPDPKISLGLDGLALSGDNRLAPNRGNAEQSVGFMQEFPNSRKRAAREERGVAEAARWQQEARLERLKLRRETALAWLEVYYLEQKQERLKALEAETRLLAHVAPAQVAGMRAMPVDALMARDLALQLADRQDELTRSMAMARARLVRYIGPDGREPLVGTPPDWALDLRPAAERPELAMYTPMRRMAEAELAEMNAEKNSDWAVELAYKRKPEMNENMAMLKFSFSLPLYAANRQNRQIAASLAEISRVEGDRQAMLREVTAMQEADQTEYAALSRQLQRQQTEAIPLAEQKAGLVLASYEAGQGQLAVVLAARRELLEARLRAIDLQSQRHAVAARLYFAFEEVQP